MTTTMRLACVLGLMVAGACTGGSGGSQDAGPDSPVQGAGGVAQGSGGQAYGGGGSAQGTGGVVSGGGGKVGTGGGAGSQTGGGGNSGSGGKAGSGGKSGSGGVGGASDPGNGNVKIDVTKRFQTIDGFGTFGAREPCFGLKGRQGDGYTKGWSDLYLKDLGASLVRIELFAPDEVYGSTAQDVYQGWVKALNDDAKAAGIDLGVLLTVWSPPGSMKSNGNVMGGGSLLPGSYAAYGDYLNGVLDQWKSWGIRIVGLSLQNEPSLSTGYASCQYTPDQMVAMLKVVGPKLHAKHPEVRVTAPEDLLWIQAWKWDQPSNVIEGSIEKAILADTTAANAVDMWATHSYNSPKDNQFAFTHFYENVVVPSGKKPFWQTEVCFFSDNWSSIGQAEGKGDALDWAWQNYEALEHGHVSANFFWEWYDGRGAELEGLLSQPETPNNKYVCAKHYWKHIRPGAVNVATSTTTGVKVTTFVHEQQKTMTIVLLNLGGGSESITLSGAGVPTQFTAYTSNASSKWVQSSVGRELTIGASTIMTLVGSI